MRAPFPLTNDNTTIDDGGMLMHLYIAVNAEGQGPLNDDDPLTVAWICWCSELAKCAVNPRILNTHQDDLDATADSEALARLMALRDARGQAIEAGAMALYKLRGYNGRKPHWNSGDAEHVEAAAVVDEVTPILTSAERAYLGEELAGNAATMYGLPGRAPGLYELLAERGVDRDRLTRALNASEDWGNMVHAFEFLTVLGTVLSCWPAGDFDG